MVLSAARRAEVLQWIQAHGVAHVNELAQSLGVSTSTIRRDLSIMQEEGLLTRVHGGAMLDADEIEPRRTDRVVEHAPEKARIAAAAANLLEDDTTILVSGGTTTEALLPFLAGRRFTVVTNSVSVALALAETPTVQVVVLGGYLRQGELSLLGQMTRSAVDGLSIDVTITGAFGLDRAGVTGAHIAEAETDRYLTEAASRLVVLADGSKFGRRGPVRIAAAMKISTLVTDAGAPDEEVQALREAGTEVIVV